MTRVEILSSHQAADYLGLSHGRVNKLLLQGRISARKIGAGWAIYKTDLDRFAAIPRKGGRPKR